MRKLNFLKSIVDYVWIIFLIVYPIIFVLSILLIFDCKIIDVPIKISGNTLNLTNIWNKLVLILYVLNFGIMLYAVFQFRNLLEKFKSRKIFESDTCLLMDQIGKLIIYGSVVYLLADILFMFSKNNILIEIGYNPFLYLIALGLFFRVLSEVFKIGKHLKEENELTI